MKFALWSRADAAAPDKKAYAERPVIAFHGAGRPVWSARDASSLTRTGFLSNPVGFRCIKLIAEACGAVPLILQGSQERFLEHPLLSLLARPNMAQSRAEFFEALTGQLLLSGDGYVKAVGTAEEDMPRELHILRSDRVRIIPGREGWPVAYEYGVGGKTQRIGLKEICHIRSFHPQDDHYGLSPLVAAANSVDVHNAASRWSKALLDNAARPSGAIVYRGVDGAGTMSPDQFDRLRGELEGHHQGAVNAGRPMLLEGGLDWKPMGFSPSDMEFQKTKEAAARDIALAFGVPPMLLGLPGDNTYANYQEANRAFYRHTVLPIVAKLCGALGPWLGQALELSADLDQITALAAERESQWSRIAAADFLDADEKRALLGLPSRVAP